MKTPKRFKFLSSADGPENPPGPREDPNGQYVLFSDFQQLQAMLEEARTEARKLLI